MRFIRRNDLNMHLSGNKKNSDDDLEKDTTGLVIGEGSPGEQINAFGILADDYFPQDNEQYKGTGIKFQVYTRHVVDEKDAELTPQYQGEDSRKKINNGEPIVIKLRQIDYCDAEGNQKKILVMCSQPFDVKKD